MKTKPINHYSYDYGMGIDVGKEELVACIRCSNGIAETPVSFPNSSIGIKQLFGYIKKKRIPGDTPILLESTGPYHFEAAYQLSQKTLNVKVVNPLHTKQVLRYSIRKRKTDKVDASHLAMLAFQDYGHPFKETKELAETKALARHYWSLKTQAANNLRHERYLKKFRNIKKFSVSGMMQKQAKETGKALLRRFKGNDIPYLDSIPGITPILAATILTEISLIERFRSAGQVIALAGLDPQVKQSGGKSARFGKLSKRGSPALRRALYFAAFGAFSRKPFNVYYQRYKGRGLHHIAILCILSRKILRICFALLKKREGFNEQYLDRT